ncbi:MAG: hypothetical protein AB7O78_15830 [Thermoleophilia bacterium]
MTLREIGAPRPARVACGDDGAPVRVEVDGRMRPVVAVRDDWLVQDLWWTGRPIDRHYWELVVDSGRLVVAYREAEDGSWSVH